MSRQHRYDSERTRSGAPRLALAPSVRVRTVPAFQVQVVDPASRRSRAVRSAIRVTSESRSARRRRAPASGKSGPRQVASPGPGKWQVRAPASCRAPALALASPARSIQRWPHTRPFRLRAARAAAVPGNITGHVAGHIAGHGVGHAALATHMRRVTPGSHSESRRRSCRRSRRRSRRRSLRLRMRPALDSERAGADSEELLRQPGRQPARSVRAVQCVLGRAMPDRNLEATRRH